MKVFLYLLLALLELHLPASQAVGMSRQNRFIDILNSQNSSSLQEEDRSFTRDDVQELYVEQRLDHFQTNLNKFQQRYFYSDRYVSESNSQQYAFLCVGGEGPALTGAVLVDSVHCSGDMLELAKKLHEENGASVHLFALEHRYYGESYPEFKDKDSESVSPVTNENLVYLSSRQALNDLAHFVEQMIEKGPTTNSNNIRGTSVPKVPVSTLWITFGGSYPGMLAGWARLKYPHLIHAAVSNSAPILPKLDMSDYNDRVAWDLADSVVGGSQQCLEIVQNGHKQIVDLLSTKVGKQTVAKAFNFCDESALDDKDNVNAFLGDGVIRVNAQSNDPSCEEPLCDIGKLCEFMTSESAKVTTKPHWSILSDVFQEQQGDECLEVNWNGTLDYIKDPVKAKGGGLRSWLWQTCTEFGFYQTCEEGTNCPYGKGYHALQQDFDICEYAFGISPEEVKESIDQTKEYYGGNKLLEGGSRILSVNGDVDPWATLARDYDVPNSNDPRLPTLLVKGASHHFWTHAVKDSDGPQVVFARKFIYGTIKGWLGFDGSFSAAWGERGIPEDMPRRPLTAYNLFFIEEKGRIIQEKDKEITYADLRKEAGRRWKDLSDDRRKYYEAQAQEDMKQVKEAMLEYRLKHTSPTLDSATT